jgi:hypothetical protein
LKKEEIGGGAPARVRAFTPDASFAQMPDELVRVAQAPLFSVAPRGARRPPESRERDICLRIAANSSHFVWERPLSIMKEFD